MSKDNEHPLKPLVEGINGFNPLATEGDVWHAIMDICIKLEDEEIDHLQATERINACIGIWLAKNNITLPLVKG